MKKIVVFTVENNYFNEIIKVYLEKISNTHRICWKNFSIQEEFFLDIEKEKPDLIICNWEEMLIRQSFRESLLKSVQSLGTPIMALVGSLSISTGLDCAHNGINHIIGFPMVYEDVSELILRLIGLPSPTNRNISAASL